uniref:FMN hydroxy acid dehydrogenase domain-containing protein n=1 Tax=Pinguiococcus pyrenoidosus TaxID=172671 RepID=A0A7R9UGG8_9STRA|mmetsp:Transcript_8863/g.33471  ORF Transcript_8863/g.33471 Transcript_8863/m.33471 type:complete len:394 (+) Transcript_8863:89-1270(+)
MADQESGPMGPAQEPRYTPTGAGPTPVNLKEYEAFAKNNMPRNAWDYYASGALDMITLRENRAAWGRLRFRPRILRDVSSIDTATTVLGQKVSMPICIAPTAMQQMAHPDGERATARAARKKGALMTLSSWSTLSLEEVAEEAPDSFRWFQLYVYKDRDVTLDLVRRAERNGYKALAVTVDTPVLGRREADVRNRFSLPSHLTMGNFAGVGGAHSSGTKSSGAEGSGLASYCASLIDRTLTWEDLRWLRANTSLKIVVKGVSTAEDASVAVREGVDAIWISNHGARQLDTTPATCEMIPEIIAAVGGRCEVYVDGGITRGADALKAVALGCRAVFIGRPVLWGLAHSGSDGVEHVLDLLKAELEMAMMLCGAVTVKDIKREMVTHNTKYFSRL